eukprot:m.443102 g.443102  ORF g.443102 m.443102 type:complete len:373 (+) comp21481_c0_seq1:82-1200(+)
MATSKRGTASGSRTSTTRSPSPSIAEGPTEYTHKPTGVFEEDLAAFCEETKTYNIEVRRVSRIPEPRDPTPEPVDDADNDLRPDNSVCYSTIRFSDCEDFFRPNIKLESTGANEEPNTAMVSGWIVKPPACKSILWSCAAQLVNGSMCISTFVFTNTQLDSESIDAIASYLEKHQMLSSLRIDSNQVPLDPTRIARLLVSDHDSGARSSLRTLALRFDALSDDAAYAIAAALTTNTTLLSLNVYGNAIGDPGAIRIFRALRLNRVLRALDLGKNSIGDMTVAEAASTLTEFVLTHEEIVQRRRLLIGGTVDSDESSGIGCAVVRVVLHRKMMGLSEVSCRRPRSRYSRPLISVHINRFRALLLGSVLAYRYG